MSFYVVNTEYDMDTALDECMKLIELNGSTVRLGFNNMKMVHIFMVNLTEACDKFGIDPEEQDFHMDVLVGTTGDEDLLDEQGS
tara:strand:+ start:61 stop:312 length:252 start_codon:yes stop_codon:yes gene_type:complete